MASCDGDLLKRGQVEGLDGFDDILRFGSVGSDVLYRSGADRSRYRRQVFRPPQTEADAPFHELLPVESRFCPYRDAVARGARDRETFACGVQQRSVKILRKEDVVASAQNTELSLPDVFVCSEVVAQRGCIAELHDAVGGGGDAETVPSQQVGMQDFPCHNGANLPKIYGIFAEFQ